jgi:hypothetical protein
MAFELIDDRSIAHSFLPSPLAFPRLRRWKANVAQSLMPTTRTKLTTVLVCYAA